MKTPTILLLLFGVVAFDSECTAQDSVAESIIEVVLTQDVNWKPLNPARGNKGPQAGALWGDQTGTGPSGFLVKFVDGFSSPPHIHNISYRAIVISGGLHNDDPDAKPMWMSPGSYWTQPAGEVHITSARGAGVAYVEIENGPYLVLPSEEAFDNGERPVNIDASNIVWLDASNTSWIKQAAESDAAKGPKIAFLWGKAQENQLNGALISLPAGFSGKISQDGTIFRCVVVEGQLEHTLEGSSSTTMMDIGSYFGMQNESTHAISSVDETILYVRSNNTFAVVAD